MKTSAIILVVLVGIGKSIYIVSLAFVCGWAHETSKAAVACNLLGDFHDKNEYVVALRPKEYSPSGKVFFLKQHSIFFFGPFYLFYFILFFCFLKTIQTDTAMLQTKTRSTMRVRAPDGVVYLCNLPEMTDGEDATSSGDGEPQ